MNAAAQVVGQSSTVGDQSYHAFRWARVTGIQDLGTLGGSFSTATALNATGGVAGLSATAGDLASHAFYWTAGGGMQDLGTLGGSSSQALSVNDPGQVVGYSYIAGNVEARPFSWTFAGGMQDMGSFGGTFGNAVAINATGQAVGASNTPGNTASHAFLWTALNGMRDLGTLPNGKSSSAVAINATGQVVGGSTTGASYHAFVWTAAGGMRDLGTLGGTTSIAYLINDAGQVVGTSTTAGDAEQHGFVWTAADGMRDLGSLGGKTVNPAGMNAAGQVVGYATTSVSERDLHAFLWTVADGMEDLFPSTGLDGAYAISDNLTVEASRGRIAQLTLIPNQAPTAAALSIATPTGAAIPITLLGSDPEGGALTYAVVIAPQHGGLSGVAPALIYTPTAGYVGPDLFTYRVQDPKGLSSAAATVSITVVSPGGTPPGTNIVVTPIDPTTGTSPVTLAFAAVTTPGMTTVSSSGTGAPPPLGFKMGSPPVYYDLQTTATFSGAVSVCFSYAPGAFTKPAALRLFHGGAVGAWTDVTTSNNPLTGKICGSVSSFSPFIVAELRYDFTGFFKPVDNPGTGATPVVNAVKAGSTVPVKFSLGGDLGLDVLALNSPRSAPYVCVGGTSAPAHETRTAGASSLAYDTSAGQYLYVWKTDKAWAGTCRKLTLALIDGTEHVALFKFTQ